MQRPFEAAEKILLDARAEGRDFLFEYEVYDLLRAVGVGEPPPYALLRTDRDTVEPTGPFWGEEYVLKIVHPRILHKSDVGGVRMVNASRLESAAAEMRAKVPLLLTQSYFENELVPQDLRNLSPSEMEQTLRREIRGILVVPKIDAPAGFGRELLLGCRLTREFGPVVTAGLGGLDTELLARELRPGRAALSAGLDLMEPSELASWFQKTLAFQKISGKTRDRTALASEEYLAELVRRFTAFVRHFSPLNPEAPFWITESEINPFLFSGGAAVPVDGLLKFTLPRPSEIRPPVQKLSALLKPRSICVLGASSKGMNVGRIILSNLLHGGFSKAGLSLVREDGQAVDGVTAFRSIAELPSPVDLMILSIPAPDVPAVLEETISHEKASSIILITGGMGETSGGKSIEERIKDLLRQSRGTPSKGPVLVGGNSLGVVSGPGNYDTLFIPETRLPRRPQKLGRNVSVLSQSGAFMITRMSRMGGFVPRYGVSTGNQIDLGTADFLEHLLSDPDVDVFSCYIEGFRDGEGFRFAKAARKAVSLGKDVIVYKAGRTTAGKKAAGGHTAAIAGDWTVSRDVLTQAGCLVAETFEEASDLLLVSSLLAHRPVGEGRLGAISNAGYETVGIADQMDADSFELRLAVLEEPTITALQKLLAQHRLTGLQDIRNPMDLTPMAADQAHLDVLRVLAEDADVDVLVTGCVPLTAAINALEPQADNSYAQGLLRLMREFKKPLVAVIDAGSLYDPFATSLLEGGMPVFRSIDRALSALGRWVRARRR
ncbi:MAG: acetate--CoA ligase family protein [Pseudomonadota bacterium]